MNTTIATKVGRGLALATALVAGIAFTAPTPAHAVSTGAAVGIGLGAFALGSAAGGRPVLRRLLRRIPV